MTLQNLRDIFVLENKLMARRKGVKEILVSDKEIAYFYSKALQDIVNRLKVVITSQTVSLTASTTFTSYTIGNTFNGLIGKPEINGSQLEEVGLDEIPKTGTMEQGQPNKFSIYFDSASNDWKMAVYPLPSTNYTVTLFSYVDTGIYDAGSLSSQNFGQFDGAQLQGEMFLPEKYTTLVVLGILSNFWEEKKMEYEVEIQKMKNSQTSTVRKLRYNWSI